MASSLSEWLSGKPSRQRLAKQMRKSNSCLVGWVRGEIACRDFLVRAASSALLETDFLDCR